MPVVSQQPSPSPSTGEQVTAPAIAHDYAVKFAEVTGARQHLIENLDKMMQAGADALKRDDSTTYSPSFIDEWTKRMRTRFNADEYVAVMVRVFEHHFTPEELKKMVEVQQLPVASRAAAMPEALKAKLASQGIAIQSEIMGGCAEIGAKAGGEIGQELVKEHPDWVKPAAPKKP